MTEVAGIPQDPTTTTRFACEIAVEGDAMHLIPVGELDVATVPVVVERLQEVREAGFTQIVLDLRRLVFLDSTGLSLILRWATRRAEGDPGTFRVIPGPAAVQRIFEVTGTAAAIDFLEASAAEDADHDGRLVASLDERIAGGMPLTERFVTLWGRALADHRARSSS